MTRDEVLELVAGDRRVGLGEQARRGGERGRGAVRRAELVRRPERQDLPPRLPGRLEPVDEAVRLVAEPAARQRGRVQEDSASERVAVASRFDSRRSSKLHSVVPLPKTNEPPPRIQIQRVTPQVDCGRYPGEAHRGRPRRGRPRASSATATRCSAPPSATSRRARPAGARRRSSRSATTSGRGSFARRPLRHAGAIRVEAWVDRVASFQDELRRKVDAGQEDLASELAEGARAARRARR